MPKAAKTKKKNAPSPAVPESYRPRLMEKYSTTVVPSLREHFGYSNPMQVPRLIKISLNMGIGTASRETKLQEEANYILRTIAGQQPILRRARMSVAGFKVRQGMIVGCSVTLRRWRMWEFLDRFIHIALPRVRDFRGLSLSGFDGRGNYTRGIRDHSIFPELDYQKIARQHGLNMTIVTTAETDEEALILLKALGCPFQDA